MDVLPACDTDENADARNGCATGRRDSRNKSDCDAIILKQDQEIVVGKRAGGIGRKGALARSWSCNKYTKLLST